MDAIITGRTTAMREVCGLSVGNASISQRRRMLDGSLYVSAS